MNPAVATIIGAVIGALATFAAGYLNFIKPSERQVDHYEPYRRLADENAGRKEEIGQLRQDLTALRQENSKLVEELAKGRASVDAMKKSLEASKAEEAARRSSVTPEPKAQASLTPKLETPVEVAPAPSRTTRKEVILTTGDAMRVRDDVTVTLSDVNQNGAFLMINGGIYNYQRIGNRIDLSVKSRERCFLEILSLTPKDPAPGRVRADLVCEPRA